MPPHRRHLQANERNQAIGMLEAGDTQRHVAILFGVSQSVISRLWTRFHGTGTVNERRRSGRPLVTSQRQDRYIVTLARRQRFQPAPRLTHEFNVATGLNITPQTLRNRLHDSNLRAYRPAVRPRLLPRHRQARLEFARQHVNWDNQRWEPVLFTDESRFCLDFDDGRRGVWREARQRYSQALAAEHSRFGGGSVMIWGRISLTGRTDMVAIRNGALTALGYRDEILHPVVRLFAGAIGPNFILMDDNARPHRAHVVQEYLQRETIERMGWPAVSPDLNPIEHVWDQLQHRLSQRPNQPQTLDELENALREEWNNLPQQNMVNLIMSMQRRCQAVLRARGGHTEY